MNSFLIGAFFFFTAAACPAANIALYCPPTPYRSVADNPFRAGIEAGTMFLEDFEDGRVNTPFIDEESSGGGGRNTVGVTQFLSGENNSVDGDDGALDGANLLGVGWTRLVGESRISIVFQPRLTEAGDPQFPKWFGFAATSAIGGDNAYVEFTDEQEHPLGSFRIPRDFFPEYHAGIRGVGTDRFLSFYMPSGAEIMHISAGIYTIDHLTYGWYPVPEPGTATLAVLPLLLLMRHRRKEHR